MEEWARRVVKAAVAGGIGAVTGVTVYLLVRRAGLGGAAGSAAAGFVAGFVSTMLRDLLGIGAAQPPAGGGGGRPAFP